MKFAADRPFVDPEAAARQLLELVLRNDIDVGQFAYVGKVNQSFHNAGGSVAEYVAGRDYAISAGSSSTGPGRGSCCCRQARICQVQWRCGVQFGRTVEASSRSSWNAARTSIARSFGICVRTMRSGSVGCCSPAIGMMVFS
jgi:hypothetical protein